MIIISVSGNKNQRKIFRQISHNILTSEECNRKYMLQYFNWHKISVPEMILIADFFFLNSDPDDATE